LFNHSDQSARFQAWRNFLGVACAGVMLAAGLGHDASAAAGQPRQVAQAGSCTARAPRFEPIVTSGGRPQRQVQQRGAPLAAFHNALAQVQNGRAREPVTIMQFGDSHTAAPLFIGRLRELIQERYGSGGPGGLPPGLAQRDYRSRLVGLEQTGAWSASSARRAGAQGPFGLSAYRLRADEPGAAIIARVRENEGVDRLEMLLMREPGSGNLRINIDGCALAPVATAAAARQAARLVVDLAPGSRDITVEAPNGNLEVLGWTLSRRGPGVIVENYGVNGAEIGMLGNLDPQIVTGELRHRNPALIIVAFGTNEAHANGWTEESYRQLVSERLAALRAAAPAASILVVGPPDSAVADRAPARGRGCGWRDPPTLAMVKTVQRNAARQLGLAYWDWSRLTRGPCGVHAMTRRTPPLAQPDHVHFTREGYAAAAEALFAHLMQRPAASSGGASGRGRFGIF
jgi:lysophospholipase L1-like esterase